MTASARSAASALLLVRLAQEQGVAVGTTLAGTGLELEDLRRPGAEVSAAQELAVITALVRERPEPSLGLVAGTRYHLTTYGIWGFALASSATVREATEVGVRFVDLTFSFCRLVVSVEAGELRLGLDDREVPPALRGFILARDLAALCTLARELGGLQVLRVEVALPKPLAGDEVLASDVRYGVRQSLVALDAAVLDLPLPQADELTAATMQAQCRALVEARRGRTGLAAQVRDALASTPGAMPGLPVVAGALALSERTLRRRLEQEGTSFRALADEVRELLAEELLGTGLGVAQVAGRLGYAEPASFTHAFTRWKGMSPRAWTARPAGR